MHESELGGMPDHPFGEVRRVVQNIQSLTDQQTVSQLGAHS